jgi:hypothetical protein
MFSLLAEVAPVVSDPNTFTGIPGLPTWLNALLIIVIPIVVYYLRLYLLKKIQEAEAHIKTSSTDDATNLRWRVEEFLLMRAEAFVERDFVILAKQAIAIKNSTDTKEEKIASVKKLLYDLGENLKGEAVAYFKTQDIDIVAQLGDTWLKTKIEDIANKVSPFPGKPSTVALLEGGAEMLIQYGSKWTKDNFLSPPTITFTGTSGTTTVTVDGSDLTPSNK